jgi:eukaryotic-like serine/threonine-protein kinase
MATIPCPQCKAINRDTARYCAECGAPLLGGLPKTPAASAAARPGGVLPPDTLLDNRYRIAGELGRGGFGAVYRAWDTRLNRRVAVKENLEASPEAQRQFTREATVLANLAHPNLPRVSDHFIVPGQGQYLVMDFIEGEDLEHRVKQQGALPVEDALDWTAQVADALAYLHSQQPPVLHRDIKPANIRITPQGQAMLVDFGLVKLFDPGIKTTLGARAVTPGYAPPEQYGSGKTDARSDIYALAATLYYLLSGVDPMESVQRMTGDAMPTVQQHNPGVPPPVSQAIQRAMSLEPARRFASAAEFKQALAPGPAAAFVTPFPAPAAPTREAPPLPCSPAVQAPVAGPPSAQPPGPGSLQAPGQEPRQAYSPGYAEAPADAPQHIPRPAPQAAPYAAAGQSVSGAPAGPLAAPPARSAAPASYPAAPEASTQAIAPARKRRLPLAAAGIGLGLVVCLAVAALVFAWRRPAAGSIARATSTPAGRAQAGVTPTRPRGQSQVPAHTPAGMLPSPAPDLAAAQADAQALFSIAKFLDNPRGRQPSGQLDLHSEKPGLAYWYTLSYGVDPYVTNGIASVAFTNPASPPWDVGFMFRALGDHQGYQVYLDSAGNWTLRLAQTAGVTPIAGGRAPGLDTAPGVKVPLQIVFNDRRGYLLLDRKVIAVLDLSAWKEPGEVLVGAGFDEQHRAGGKGVRYSNFSVYSLP